MRTDSDAASAIASGRANICASLTSALLLAFAFADLAESADVHWDNGGAGTAWTTGANWDNGGADGVPTGADRANVSFSSGADPAPGAGVNGPVTFNTTTTVSSVRIGGFTGSGFGGAGMLQLNGGTLTVDNTGGTGTGFQLAITNNATLDGTFEMNGASTVLNVRDGNFETATAGTGVATINNGTLNQLTNNLIVGQDNTSNATFIVNGGLVDIQNQLRVANNAATGLYTQTDGTVNVGTTFAMSDHGGGGASGSTANISGGILNISDRAGGGWLIGSTNNAASSADVTVSGDADVNVIRTGVRIADRGANSVGSLTLSGTATIDVDAGNTEVADNGTGTLDIQGGTYSQNAANIIVGQESTSNATMTVSGGLVDIQNQLRIANRGTGLVTLNSGTVNVGTTLDLANNNTADSDATLTMNGGVLNVSDRAAGNLIIGNENRATSTSQVNILDGTVNVHRGSILIANNGANSSGTLIVGKADGTTSPVINLNLVSAGNFETANIGDGVFTFHSGTITQNDSNLITGQSVGSEATVTVGGGVGTAVLNMTGGNGLRDWNTNGGHGIVSVLTNGTINVGRDMNLGNNADANSGLELTIDGGTVRVGANGTSVGNINYRTNGPQDAIMLLSGLLDGNGGTINLANQGASSGDFVFSGGTLQNFGNFVGNLDQQGGTLEIGDPLAANPVDTMNVSAGGSELGTYTQGAAGTLVIDIQGTNGPGALGGHDQLLTASDATLLGTLELRPTNGLVAAGIGQPYTIVNQQSGASPVSGPFIGLTEGSIFISQDVYHFQITYAGGTGNDVVLTLLQITPEPSSLVLGVLALFSLGVCRRRKRSRP